MQGSQPSEEPKEAYPDILGGVWYVSRTEKRGSVMGEERHQGDWQGPELVGPVGQQKNLGFILMQ